MHLLVLVRLLVLLEGASNPMALVLGGAQRPWALRGALVGAEPAPRRHGKVSVPRKKKVSVPRKEESPMAGKVRLWR